MADNTTAQAVTQARAQIDAIISGLRAEKKYLEFAKATLDDRTHAIDDIFWKVERLSVTLDDIKP